MLDEPVRRKVFLDISYILFHNDNSHRDSEVRSITADNPRFQAVVDAIDGEGICRLPGDELHGLIVQMALYTAVSGRVTFAKGMDLTEYRARDKPSSIEVDFTRLLI